MVKVWFGHKNYVFMVTVKRNNDCTWSSRAQTIHPELLPERFVVPDRQVTTAFPFETKKYYTLPEEVLVNECKCW